MLFNSLQSFFYLPRCNTPCLTLKNPFPKNRSLAPIHEAEHLGLNQNSQIQTPKYKTPKTLNPRSRIQNENISKPKNQKPQIQDPESKIASPKTQTPIIIQDPQYKIESGNWQLTPAPPATPVPAWCVAPGVDSVSFEEGEPGTTKNDLNVVYVFQ